MNTPNTDSLELRVAMLELVLAEVVEKLADALDKTGAQGGKWKVQYPTVHGQQTMLVERTQ
jgi:hypothetical protein